MKVLYNKLEYDGSKNGISFVGISNWSLDAAKLNWALCSSVPNLDEDVDDLIETSKSIVDSISNKLIKESKESKEKNFVDLIPFVHFNYKKVLSKLKQLMLHKLYILDQLKRQKISDIAKLTNEDKKK